MKPRDKTGRFLPIPGSKDKYIQWMDWAMENNVGVPETAEHFGVNPASVKYAFGDGMARISIDRFITIREHLHKVHFEKLGRIKASLLQKRHWEDDLKRWQEQITNVE